MKAEVSPPEVLNDAERNEANYLSERIERLNAQAALLVEQGTRVEFERRTAGAEANAFNARMVEKYKLAEGDRIQLPTGQIMRQARVEPTPPPAPAPEPSSNGQRHKTVRNGSSRSST
jgi:hypothetical protein